MVEYLVTLSRKRTLEAKDIALINQLNENGNGGVSLTSLVERASRATREMEKLHQRLDKREGSSADAILVAKILLRASMLSPRAVYAVRTVGADTLPPVEKNFCTALQVWCDTHLQRGVLSMDTGTSKRGRDEDEDEIPEPPAHFIITDEQLDDLREVLRPCEVEFRNLLKDELLQEDNVASVRRIFNLVPPEQRYNAIILAGVHEDVPGDALRKTALFLGHIYGFQVDFERFDSLIEGGRDRLRLRKNSFTSVVIPLRAPQYAVYGGSLFLSEDGMLTPPDACIWKDVPRPKIKLEQYGMGDEKAMRQFYYAHATWFPPEEATRTPVGIIRAIRMDTGAYEWSLAVATNYVRERAGPILDSYPDTTLHTEVHYLQRYVKTSTATKGSKSTYARANELVLQVSIASMSYDVDNHELVNQIRSAIGVRRDDSNVVQVEGIYFLTCLEETSPSFNCNFPAEVLSAPNSISVVSPLDETLDFKAILRALADSLVDLSKIKHLYVQRFVEYDPSDADIKKGKADNIIIVWDGQAGDLSRVTLRQLCGQLTGTHSSLGEPEPGVNLLKKLDNVLRLIATQPGPDGKPGKPRYTHKQPLSVEVKQAVELTPRRRANEKSSSTGPRQSTNTFAEALLNTSAPEPRAMSVDRHEGPSVRAHMSPFTPLLSRSLWQDQPSTPRGTPSMAVNLGTGESSVQAFPNMALKAPGSSEVSTVMLDQFKAFRDQMTQEKREDERRRAEREAVRDAEFQALQTKVNNLDNTIAASVSGSLSMAFNSPAFATMIAQAVQAGINTTSSASAAQQKGGPSHNADRHEE